MKAYWPNILFYNIEYGLYIARDITELYSHGRCCGQFLEERTYRAYTCVFWPLLQ